MFYITLPKSQKKFYLDNRLRTPEERIQEVEKALAFHGQELLNYALDSAFIRNGTQYRSYVRAVHTLENLATYILELDKRDSGILKLPKMKELHAKELPASCLAGNAEDLIYGSSHGSDREAMSLSASFAWNGSEAAADIFNQTATQIAKQRRKEERRSERFRSTRNHRLNQLYSTPRLRIYKVVPLSNKEIELTVNGRPGRLPAPDEAYHNGRLDQREYERWLDKPARNAFRQPILMDRPVEIGGRNGLIGVEQPYLAEWRPVDIDGCFTFNGDGYQISDEVRAYRADRSGHFQMDRILCYEVNGHRHFYDQLIHEIDRRYILDAGRKSHE